MCKVIRTVLMLAAILALAAPRLLAKEKESGEPGKSRIGQLDAQADVGKVNRPGSAEYIAERREYRVTGSGENIWGKQDAFHFLYRKASGDLTVAAEVSFEGEGKNKHRKACWMVRQSLNADAPYADVAVHGDGLVSLQYRKEPGGATAEVQAKVKSPAAVRLERRGNVFTLWVQPKGEEFQKAGSAEVALNDPVDAGLAVSSHEADLSETAVFKSVTIQP